MSQSTPNAGPDGQPPATPFADDSWCIDIHHQGNANAVATAALRGADGRLALIDPGPSSALGGLEAGLARAGFSLDDVAAIVLTHIHLDHAGATGTLVRRNPDVRVFVHERGARHMVDPSRLLESAGRIYGDAMDRLWGEFLAVPEASVQTLAGGETIAPIGRELEVLYGPGHASHHVCYLDRRTGTAFVGDDGGIRIAGAPLVLPVTPPPDIDVELWRETIGRIRAWRPERLFVTHFGVAAPVDEHLDELETRLLEWAEQVRASLDEPGEDADKAERFADGVRELLRSHLTPEQVERYLGASGPADSWWGLARYWRKKAAG